MDQAHHVQACPNILDAKPHHVELSPVDQLRMHISAAAVISGLSEAFSIDSVGTTFTCSACFSRRCM